MNSLRQGKRGKKDLNKRLRNIKGRIKQSLISMSTRAIARGIAYASKRDKRVPLDEASARYVLERHVASVRDELRTKEETRDRWVAEGATRRSTLNTRLFPWHRQVMEEKNLGRLNLRPLPLPCICRLALSLLLLLLLLLLYTVGSHHRHFRHHRNRDATRRPVRHGVNGPLSFAPRLAADTAHTIQRRGTGEAHLRARCQRAPFSVSLSLPLLGRGLFVPVLLSSSSLSAPRHPLNAIGSDRPTISRARPMCRGGVAEAPLAFLSLVPSLLLSSSYATHTRALERVDCR